MDGWKTTFLLGWPIFSFRECRCVAKKHVEDWMGFFLILEVKNLLSGWDYWKPDWMGFSAIGTNMVQISILESKLLICARV